MASSDAGTVQNTWVQGWVLVTWAADTSCPLPPYAWVGAFAFSILRPHPLAPPVFTEAAAFLTVCEHWGSIAGLPLLMAFLLALESSCVPASFMGEFGWGELTEVTPVNHTLCVVGDPSVRPATQGAIGRAQVARASQAPQPEAVFGGHFQEPVTLLTVLLLWRVRVRLSHAAARRVAA